MSSLSSGRGPDAPHPPSDQEGRYVSLLTQVMSQPLDRDYQVVAQRRARGAAGSVVEGASIPADDEVKQRSLSITTIAALAVFGVMVGVSALQTERDAPVVRAERSELIEQIRERQSAFAALQGDLNDLTDDVTELQAEVAGDVQGLGTVTRRLDDLGVAAGTVSAVGPGITITVDDAAPASPGSGGVILASDLRLLVNGLWEAGAEAIAIDGHRLTSLTAIRFAGEAITVDYRSLTTPYVVTVIGDVDTLAARFNETDAGQAWIALEVNFGIGFAVTSSDELEVPGDPQERLRHARPREAE